MTLPHLSRFGPGKILITGRRGTLSAAAGPSSWQPVIRGASSAGTGTTTATATWMRIGNLVQWSMDVSWSGHTGTGAFEIAGFPFSSSASRGRSTGAIGRAYFPDVEGTVQIHLDAGGNVFRLWRVPGGAANSVPVNVIPAGHFVASGSFFVEDPAP